MLRTVASSERVGDVLEGAAAESAVAVGEEGDTSGESGREVAGADEKDGWKEEEE